MFLLAVLAGFLGTRLTWGDHPLGTSLQTGLACALAVFGLGIAVSSFLGRTGAGSIFLAIVTAGLLAGSAAVPEKVGTEWVRPAWKPVVAADVRDQYDIGAGSGTLDLSRLDLAEGQTVTTRADVGMGPIRVLVPQDVTVRLNVEVGVGDIQLPGDDEKDVDVAPGKHEEITLTPAEGGKDGGTLDLDLQVGMGRRRCPVLRHDQPGRLVAGVFLMLTGVVYAGDAGGLWETPWFVVIPLVNGGLCLAGAVGVVARISAHRRRADLRTATPDEPGAGLPR
ncbi:hypothetical protein SVIOM342S_02602 [Streptomyces violaceorubidus]